MFEHLILKEFGGVYSCSERLNFHRFNVLIGPNNSGKTTIMMALFLLPYPPQLWGLPILKEDKFIFLSKYLGKLTQALIYRYYGKATVISSINSLELEYQIHEDGSFHLYSNKEEITSSDSFYSWLPTVSNVFEIESIEEAETKLRGYVIFIPSSDSFRSTLEYWLMENWEAIERTGVHVSLVRELSGNVVSDRFTELLLKRNELVLRKELEKDVAYIRLKDLGDGVKRFLTTAFWIEAVKPKVVLWDDIESSAHPALIHFCIKWLANHDWQVIISTHSIDVLHEVLMVEPEDTRIIQLNKNQYDVLSYREYTLEDLEKMFEEGLDVRRLFAPVRQDEVHA
ncbi:MAG: ATP-binding protein [Thaumarchaeota archaeon]|jgi:energy-coupling factor transporter ATP-binding protein EcfA2|nr:ATP-binding protein [Candidatus Geocrenenecus arthurdayi]